MVYGRGQGAGVGAGLGFRGTSPPWPYVGRGRGGLPRCSYFSTSRTLAASETTLEAEINLLKAQSDELGRHLSDIEARIKELQAKEEK